MTISLQQTPTERNIFKEFLKRLLSTLYTDTRQTLSKFGFLLLLGVIYLVLANTPVFSSSKDLISRLLAQVSIWLIPIAEIIVSLIIILIGTTYWIETSNSKKRNLDRGRRIRYH